MASFSASTEAILLPALRSASIQGSQGFAPPTPTVRLGTPGTSKRLFKRGFNLSGYRDLNSGPSVPQIDAPQTADLRKRPETASGLPF